MKMSEPISDLAKALAKAQGQFTAAERAHVAKVQSKKGEGSSYQYSYADLQAYLDVVREPLASAGLSFVQLPTVHGDEAAVVTILMHESGQFIESDPLTLTVDHDPDKRPTPQAIGSAITYARRYSLSALTGMASEADDDGAGASGLSAETGRREPNPACPKCGNNKNVIKGKEEYGGGWLCYAKKGGCGEKWHDPVEPTEEQRAKAADIAKNHNMTTADKLPTDKLPTSAAYKKAIDKITAAIREGNVDEVARILNVSETAHSEGKLSDAEHKALTHECTLALRKIKAMESEPLPA